jgi:dsRNA-specific ribonuclease
MSRNAHGSNKLNAFVLPPLPDSLPLPALPPISDPVLRDRAFTHTSLYSVARITHDLETSNYPEIQDYEKLEYIGDTIIGEPSVGLSPLRLTFIGVCADLLVHEIYPNMRQGVATAS